MSLFYLFFFFDLSSTLGFPSPFWFIPLLSPFSPHDQHRIAPHNFFFFSERIYSFFDIFSSLFLLFSIIRSLTQWCGTRLSLLLLLLLLLPVGGTKNSPGSRAGSLGQCPTSFWAPSYYSAIRYISYSYNIHTLGHTIPTKSSLNTQQKLR